MPNKSAAKKALRQTKTHARANVARREAFKKAVKKVLKATSVEEAMALASKAQQALDKAAKAGTIKKNTAARRLSRLLARVRALAQK